MKKSLSFSFVCNYRKIEDAAEISFGPQRAQGRKKSELRAGSFQMGDWVLTKAAKEYRKRGPRSPQRTFNMGF